MKVLLIATLVLSVFLCPEMGLFAEDYDPLRLPDEAITVEDFDLQDAERNRQIPLRVYAPDLSSVSEPLPVILYSHGLGGSRRASRYTGEHWAARGYVVVCMQHAGSDESVWKDKPMWQRRSALQKAASATSTIDRFLDVKFTLDGITRWTKDTSHSLYEKIDLNRVGMSGHSFGAVTTQGVSGQTSRWIGDKYLEKRIRAALMFSPSKPRRGNAEESFSKVSIPWMLMTGTKDGSPIGNGTAEDRREVYPALPQTIDKYELVLFEAEHSAFGDEKTRNARRNPNHHRTILACSTAFWDCYLKQNNDARKWLQGADVASVKESADEWQLSLREGE